MESKRKNVYIVIFVITTIVASCVAVYFGIVKDREIKDLQAQIQDLTNEQNNKIDTTVDESANNSEVEVEEKVVEKVVEKYGILEVNEANCLNKKNDNVDYSKRMYLNNSGFEFSSQLSNENKTIELYVNIDTYKEFFGDSGLERI